MAELTPSGLISYSDGAVLTQRDQAPPQASVGGTSDLQFDGDAVTTSEIKNLRAPPCTSAKKPRYKPFCRQTELPPVIFVFTLY